MKYTINFFENGELKRIGAPTAARAIFISQSLRAAGVHTNVIRNF